MKILKYFFLFLFLAICVYIGIYLFQNHIDFPQNRVCSKNEITTTEQMQEKFKYRLFLGRDRYNGVALPGHDIHIFLSKALQKNKIVFPPNEAELGNSNQEDTIIISNGQIVPYINCANIDQSMVVHFLPEKIEVINYIDKERSSFNRF